MTTTWMDSGIMKVQDQVSSDLLKRMAEWSCVITKIESVGSQMTVHFQKPRLSGKAQMDFLEDIHVMDEILSIEVVQ